MVITDFELIQSTIELVGGFVSIVLASIILINRHEEKSMSLIVKMLFISAALFVSDALAYLFRGNTDTVSLFMTRFSNLSVFFLNFFLADTAIRYIYSILQENQVAPHPIYKRIIFLSLCAAVVILALNLFTGWMYTFDAENHYHRNWGWYVYTGLSLVCMSTSCVLVIKYRKALDRFTLFSLLLFELFPFIATVVQSIFYGISITNIGIGLSIVLVLIAYLINWNRSGTNEQRNTAQIRRSYDTVMLFIIMIISISASILSCILSIRSIASEISLSSSEVIARIVNDRIANMFLRPITVTETMSKDYSLKEYMHRSNDGDESVAEQMAAYLHSIRSGFDYQMVYVVCEQSRAYYTYDGFLKTVDPEHNAADVWYGDFVASGKPYEVKVDTDDAAGWGLSAFVNTAVLDEDGKLLGVCGIGLEMETLQRQLLEFEEKYLIRITLTDSTGQYQIQSGKTKLGPSPLPLSVFENGEELFWEEQDGILSLTQCMQDSGWYLTVEDLSSGRVNIVKMVVPNLVIFLAGLFILAVAFCVITIRERQIARELMEKRRTSSHDELTGLKNRRALQEDCKKIEQSGTLWEQTVILMDLNGLKATNDDLGHQAGDELIIGMAQCLKKSLHKYGQLYRTGGDEFVLILNCTQEELGNALAEFDSLASSWRGNHTGPISTARGIVVCKEYPHLNFAALVDMADRRMYEDKKQYYLNAGKKRR